MKNYISIPGIDKLCVKNALWCCSVRAHYVRVNSPLLNIVMTVDVVKAYIEKEFIPKIRRSFECPNHHFLSSHWIFYNTS